jgi:vitellogenic carboxypeptidase-like protein
MFYNGQLDIIIPVPMTEAFLLTVPWSGAQKYKQADRLIWKVNPSDTEVAGYVRQVGGFYQVRYCNITVIGRKRSGPY